MVIARLFRLVLALAVVALVLILFFYAFVAALIVAPILALLFFFFGRKVGPVWVVGRPDPRQEPGAPAASRAPPVIDHDPNDLPEDKP